MTESEWMNLVEHGLGYFHGLTVNDVVGYLYDGWFTDRYRALRYTPAETVEILWQTYLIRTA